MKDQFSKLIDLKSLITLMLVGVTCYGFIARTVPIEAFIALVVAVITYYFTRSVPAAPNTTTTTETTISATTTDPPTKPT